MNLEKVEILNAVFTPMFGDGIINYKRVPDLFDHCVSTGADGIFLNGTTGECMSLSVDERLKLVEAWTDYRKKVNRPDFKIFVHVGSCNLYETAHMAEHAQAHGVDGILHHLELMENIENLVYANSRFYSFLCSFRLMVLSTKKHSKKDGVIQSIEYMREHINGMITLEELATVAGLSVSHYCAMFKQKTMQTPMQLYTSMKIQRACQLLQNRNQTIKSVSYSLGFFDQYHFSKVFKQVMGVAPKNFRKQES